MNLIQIVTTLDPIVSRSTLHETPYGQDTPRTTIVLDSRDDFDGACSKFGLTPVKWANAESWYAIDTEDLGTYTLMLQWIDTTPPPAPADDTDGEG